MGIGGSLGTGLSPGLSLGAGKYFYLDVPVFQLSDNVTKVLGEMVEARVLPDTVEAWYGDRKVEELPRLRGRGKHRVDYRHMIDWLVRKPGAFENYRYRSDLFRPAGFVWHTTLCGRNKARSAECRST